MNLVSECEKLREIPLFRDLDTAKCKLVAMSSDRLHYQAGDVVFEEGDPSDAVYFMLSGRIRVSRELKGRLFDVALCMHASMRVNLLCRSIPTGIRLGFDRKRARDFQWLFTNSRIPAGEKEHALDAMMSFATATGARPTALRWDLPLSPEAVEFAAGFGKNQRPLVVISPCSSQRSRNFRNWSIENYAAVIGYLREAYGCTVVLTGGGALLGELDLALREQTGLAVSIADESVICLSPLASMI